MLWSGKKRTLESFPGKKTLKDRVNIVITRNSNYFLRDAIVVHDVEQALKEATAYKIRLYLLLVEGAFMNRCFRIVPRHMLPTLIIHMKQIHTFRICQKIRNGNWLVKVRNRHILMWNFILENM
jgi:hypothetical protein